MRVLILCLTLCVATLAASCQPKDITTIAFGSCSNQDSTQLWDDIVSQKPQLWIWLGDNIYGDTHDRLVLRKKYDRQKADMGYQRLLSQCPIVGTWDDHDFGQNDGGRFYSRKEESKVEMLRFFDITSSDPITKHQGVYNAHVYGTGNRKVKVILLDTRTFRDTIYHSSTPGRVFEPNLEGDILGEDQWQWLESQFKDSDAAIHIIGSSIQFIANDHTFEKWGNFPKAKQRMIDLLKKYKPGHPIIISGDRHIAEISRMDVEGLSTPLYDFTSSGLTHTWKGIKAEKNQYRIGQLIVQKNYGLIKIDWSGKQAVVTLEVRGKQAAPFDTPVVIR